MAFNLLAFLNGILGGLKVDGIQEKAVAWLKQAGTDYPDVKDRTDALEAWLRATVAEASPALDPASMEATIKGIAADIVKGTAGVDPDAWMVG